MPAQPLWFTQLHWSTPLSIADVNTNREVIPVHAGVYVFTHHNIPLSPDRVLYVGEAKNGLRRRLTGGSYLVRQIRLMPPRPGGGERRFHKGAAFILEARQRWGDQAIYLRWAEYGAGPEHILDLEASLQDYLNPACNDRDESLRRPLMGDWESLIPGAY